MIRIPQFKDKSAAVFGLGASGRAAVAALGASGAQIVAWDDSDAARDALVNDPRMAEFAAAIDLAPIDEWNWEATDALVLSPGVPLHHPAPHPVVAAARANGVEIIGDMELVARALGSLREDARPKIVAVTGTNGKSTTSALIAHMLAACNAKVHLGGNIGRPALELPLGAGGEIYVLELSSYQLDLTTSFHADAAVFLNLTADHIDRHGDMAGYAEAKKRIFNNQTAEDVAIIGVDDDWGQSICTEIAGRGSARVIPIAVDAALGRGVFVAGGRLFANGDGPARAIVDLGAAAALRGAHNWQNAAAAFAACDAALPGRREDLAQALLSFPGLAHRQEQVGRKGAILFVNDSKATNPEAAAKALASYERIWWIAGGRAKEGGFDPLTSHLDHVEKAYLIGEAAEALGALIEPRAPVSYCADLACAAAEAAKDAEAAAGEGERVVLLSPACASFDQYKNFEARGDHFRDIIAAALNEDGAAA